LEDRGKNMRMRLKISVELKDPVLPITHCALTIIGGHFLDVEKSEN